MEDKYTAAYKHIKYDVESDLFQRFVLDSKNFKQELFSAIRTSRTQGIPRFQIWRLLLGITSFQSSWDQKIKQIQDYRKKWVQEKQQIKGIKPLVSKQSQQKQGASKQTVVKNPLMKVNPLVKAVGKVQKKQDSDSFLHEQIKKDVQRTYQQMNFFTQTSIIKLESNVLFLWSKLNPQISYKQGMNEVLASIVYVYFSGLIHVQASNEIQKKQKQSINTANAEADIYTVFSKIMQIQKQMFKQNLDNEVKQLVNPNSKNNPILLRIIHLMDQRLKSLDLQLFRIIKLQAVKTTTFLLRWIRCMHTRQFGLVLSFNVWDSIFLDYYQSPASKNKHQFQFIDAMCLAMFIYLRSIVLTRETANQILQAYQKFPQMQGQYLMQLICLAWSVVQELRIRNNQNEQVKNSAFVEKGQVMDKLKVTVPEKKVSDQKQTKIEYTKKLNLKNGDQQDFSINFSSLEVKKMIQLLRQSITYNENLQSKKICKQVLAKLQTKLQK